MPNNSVSIQPDSLNSLQQEYNTTLTFTSQIKHMIFDCYPVKMTVMTQFVLLVLAIFLLNLGHITKVYAHGDHTTNTHPTIYVYGFRDYNLRENSIPFDFVSVGFVRSQVMEDLTTTIRYRVYAADGLTPETDLSTKNQDGTVTGTIRTLDITDQRTTASLRIDVTKDEIDEIYEDLDPDPMRNEKRTLAIELLESNSYHLAGSADADQTLSCTHQNGEDPGPRCTTVYFSIVDDDVPLIEIEKKTTTGAISESSDWQFKLTSDIIPAEEITVPFTVTLNNPSPDSGNFFISTLPGQVQFSQNLNCGSNPPCERTFDIVNQNHVVDSFNGNASFTVALSAVASGNVGKYRIHEGANASKNSVSIEISDDLVSPTLSIAGVADSITEGNSAWFLITSSAEPAVNLTINIDVTDSQSHLKTTVPANITLKAGETQVYLQLPTKTNGMNNSGSIAVEIETGTRYLVANSPNHSDSITINDIGPLVTFTDVGPGITFTTPNAFGYRVTEGTTVQVQVTATPAPQNDLTIPIAIRDGESPETPHGAGSHFLGEHLPDTVTIRAGQSTATFQFETLDDDEHTFQGTNNGSRVVAVLILQQPGSGFEATYTNTLDINIIDNDPMPVVSIHANTDSIVEGETIRYRLSLSTKSAFTIGVNVQMTSNGFYLASNFSHRVIIHAGLLMEFFEVTTQHNNDDPASGTVTATIQSTFFYTVAAAPLNKAVVAITDRPNLALISTRDPSVTEGTNIRFEITMTHNLTKDIKIPFVVTDGVTSNYGDMETEYVKGFRETFEAEGIVEAYLGENLVIEAIGNQGEKRIEILVPTIDDDLDEPNGRIAYSLHPIIDPEYEIVFYEAGQISKVQVTDNDATPELSIAAVTSSILEGGIAQYRISTPNKSAKDLEIGLSVSETETSTATNTYFMGTVPTTVTLKAGTTEVILNVPTRAVPDGPDNQQIKVELQAGTGYDVKSTADDASISITEATIVVTLASPFGREGGNIEFEVSLSSAIPDKDITVNFVMSEEPNITMFTEENIGKVGDIFAEPAQGSVTIPRNTLFGDFTIRTTANDFDNPNRMLSYKVFHQTGPEFEISGTSVGNLTLFDNDLPPVISIAAVSNVINEGDVAQYQLTSVGSSESDLEVSLNIRDIGDFIDSTIPTSTTLKAKSTETILELQTNSDEVGDETGSIIVTVLGGTGYSVSTTASDSATIQVMSAGPLISISRVESVTEGSNIVLNLSASSIPTLNFSIPVFISDGVTSTFAKNIIRGQGNVLGSNIPTMASFTSGTSMTMVQIPTASDDLDEPTNAGIVYIEFQRSTNAVYDLGKNFPITVIVLDNDDPPTVSISAVTSKISEGGIARFKIATTQVSGIDLDIMFSIAETESFIDKFYEPTSVTFTSGTTEQTLGIRTRHDAADETAGSITVTIESGVNYSVATSPKNQAQVNVDDDFTKTTVSFEVKDGLTSITEGETLHLRFQRSAIATTQLDIFLDINISSQDFFMKIPESTAFIAENATEQLVSIPTIDNNEHQDDGMITITILEHPLYDIGTSSSASLAIIDNDITIMISAVKDTINEGESAEFLFSTSESLDSNVEINITITDLENFLSDSERNRETFEIPSGQTSSTLSIQIMDDEVRRSDGTIRVLVVSGTRYQSDATNFAEIRVKDNDGDQPAVSVVSTPDSIVEGNPIIFTISVEPNPSSPMKINLAVTQERNVILWRIPSSILLTTSGMAELKIQTRDDFEVAGEGFVRVSILVGSGYVLDGKSASKQVIVTDSQRTNSDQLSAVAVAGAVANAILNNLNSNRENSNQAYYEAVPLITVSAITPSIDESQDAEFLISSNMNTSVRIKLDIQQTGNFILGPKPKFVQFNGNSKINFLIATHDDHIAEEDGVIFVSLSEGRGYQIDKNQYLARVFVSDANDRKQYSERLSTANNLLIPELMATTGVQSYQTMSNRVQMAFDDEELFLVEVGGYSNPTEILKLSGQTLNEQIDLMDMLQEDTEIAVKLTPDNLILNNTTAWLKSENQYVYNLNHTDSTAWSGDFYTGNFGIDTQLNSGLLLGVVTSISEQEIHLTTAQTQEFQYTANYTGFSPYFALNLPALNTEFWMSSNFNSGYIDVDSDNQLTHRLDSQFTTITFGAELQLFSDDYAILNGISDLNLTSQGWFAQQNIFGDGRFTSDLTTEGHHFQVSLKGNHEIELAKIGTLNPNVLIGIRQAKKDVNSVTGLEIGLGAQYSSSFGLSFEGFGRGFKGGVNQDYATNFSGELTYNPNQDNTGSEFTISSSWGKSIGTTHLSLWQSNLAGGSDLFNQYNNGIQVKTEYNYGIKVLDGFGVLTPFSALDYSSNDQVSYNIGNRIKLGDDSSFEIKGTRELRNHNSINNKIKFLGNIQW